MRRINTDKLALALGVGCLLALNANQTSIAATAGTKHPAANNHKKVVSHKAPVAAPARQAVAPAQAASNSYDPDQYERMNQYLKGMQTYSDRYGPYVQNYPVNNYIARPTRSWEYDSPTARELAQQAQRRQQEAWRREEDSRTAMHALIEHYGTAEGSPFSDREGLTKEAVRYADLLRYARTHTYTNPDTNIAP